MTLTVSRICETERNDCSAKYRLHREYSQAETVYDTVVMHDSVNYCILHATAWSGMGNVVCTDVYGDSGPDGVWTTLPQPRDIVDHRRFDFEFPHAVCYLSAMMRAVQQHLMHGFLKRGLSGSKPVLFFHVT